MANQMMSINEIEQNVGVRHIDKVEWGKAILVGLNTLRMGFAMWGVGGTGAGVAGAIMGAGAIAAPILGFITAFLAIGLPVAKAKEFVSNKAARHGFSIGVALAIFGYGKYFMSTFVDNTMGDPGVAPKYMTGIYKNAYNASLLYGYCTANQMTPDEKKKMLNKITEIMIDEAKRKGHKLQMEAWADRDWVHHYARAFNNRMLKS